MKTQHFCTHCEEEARGEDLIDGKFCCLGCQAAYQIVSGSGLSSYYQSRVNDPKIRKIRPENQEQIDLHNFVTVDESGNFELFLAIDGISCAACVWLIETLLKKQENVTLARVNLTKRYLKLKWHGDQSGGSKLIDLIQKVGYKLYPFDEKILAKEERKYCDNLIRRLAVAGFGAGNIMLFSIVLWLYDADQIGKEMRNLIHFFTALIALPCIIYSASIFFKSAFTALKAKRMNMDISISTAILLTVSVSFYQIFHDANHIYFDSAMTLTFFLLIGKYIDFKARKKAFDISKEFLLLNSSFARIIDEDENVKIIAAKDVKKDMILLVQPGEKIAADGEVIDGESQIDNNVITGESRPIAVKKGSEVFASAINLANSVRIKAGKNQQRSLLKQIQTIIEESENHKNKFVKISDKIAGFYTPAVHIAAAITFAIWYFAFGEAVEKSLLITISVLVITCPCALALAVPIAQSLTISMALKNGIIIKSGEAIEKISKVKHFIFDKTGTLTFGRPKLLTFRALNRKLDEKEEKYYLKIAANLASNSSHPLSKAICDFSAEKKNRSLAKEIKGSGMEGEIDGEVAKLGNKSFVENFDAKYEGEIAGDYSTVFLSFKDDILVFYFQDELKKDAVDFIVKMKNQFESLTLLSGDNRKIVQKTASDLGLKNYFYEQNPLQKIAILQKLRQEKVNFAMTGDGINDAGALAICDVSISFANASNLTQNVADVIINNDEKLMPILDLIHLSQKSIKIMKQNLAFCLAYNCLALPFAVSGLVNPMIAAAAMSSSSIIVILNSLRLVR